MKKLFKLLFFLGLVVPCSVNAAEVSLDCPDTAKAGSEITCKINISSVDKVAGVQADVNVSNGLTYKSYTKIDGWGGTSSATRFLLYDNVVDGNVLLGSYIYTVDANASGNLSFSLNNIFVSDEDANALKVNSSVTDTIRVLSGVNTLSSLTVSGVAFNFSTDTTTYNLTINSDKTTIEAIAADSKAVVTGTGDKVLNIGNNKFEIVVTAENGTKKTYTLNITRNDARSSDNTLSKLELDAGTIDFKSDTTIYNVDVDVASITISATANDGKATVIGTGKKDLNYGNNKFEIVVTAENGTKKTYTLNITRNDMRSSDNKLKVLSISEGKINFTSDITEYKVTLSEDIKEITFSAEASDSKAKVEGIGTKKLELGKNNFIIKVIAENEVVREYKIIVVRGSEEVVNVPNTAKKVPLIVFILGVVFVSVGSVVIYRIKRT